MEQTFLKIPKHFPGFGENFTPLLWLVVNILLRANSGSRWNLWAEPCGGCFKGRLFPCLPQNGQNGHRGSLAFWCLTEKTIFRFSFRWVKFIIVFYVPFWVVCEVCFKEKFNLNHWLTDHPLFKTPYFKVSKLWHL